MLDLLSTLVDCCFVFKVSRPHFGILYFGGLCISTRTSVGTREALLLNFLQTKWWAEIQVTVVQMLFAQLEILPRRVCCDVSYVILPT